MIFISHRGNIDGKKLKFENHPDYVEVSFKLGYDVEIDVWYIDNKWYLGHDKPLYEVDYEFINNKRFWLHTKNIDALNKLVSMNNNLKYFWHQNDDFTLTSNGYIWTYPNKPLTKNSISVKPDLDFDKISFCYGICSDYIKKYKIMII